MKRLLAIAGWLCGESARRRVFEPLIADWDRELRDAAARPLAVRTGILIRGAIALSLTVALCAARRAFSSGGSMWTYGIAAFAAAVLLAMVGEATLIGYSIPGLYPPEMLLLGSLRIGGAAALAPAMLPALLLLRRGSPARAGVAACAIAAGSALAATGVLAQPWLADLQPTAAQNERMFQWELAQDRVGRLQYPATALRELRDATSTPELRKARYEQFIVERAQRVAKQPPRPGGWQRLRRSTIPVLTALFGLLGWSLGGVARPTLARAALWWGVAWFVTLVADGRMSNLLGLPFMRPPWWGLPAAAGIAAFALQFASARRSPDRSPDHAITSS